MSSTRAIWKRRCTGMGCGWTTATTAHTRRRRRSPSAARFTYRSSSPIPASTGTTRTSARTTARRWACTGTSSSSRPTPTTGRRSTARSLLTLDDVLIEDGKIAPFSPLRDHATRRWVASATCCSSAARPDLSLTAQAGEVVRFYLTNTANTRVFNVALPGARMKLVGGDSGRYEHEQFVEAVVLAPSERVVDRRAVRAARPTDAGASDSGPRRTRSRRSTSARTRPSRRSPSSSTSCATTRSWRPSGTARQPYVDAPNRTRRWPSSPRWTWATPRARSSTPARCIPTSSGRAGQLPEVRHEAAGHGGPRRATCARCTPRSSATSPTSARSAA